MAVSRGALEAILSRPEQVETIARGERLPRDTAGFLYWVLTRDYAARLNRDFDLSGYRLLRDWTFVADRGLVEKCLAEALDGKGYRLFVSPEEDMADAWRDFAESGGARPRLPLSEEHMHIFLHRALPEFLVWAACKSRVGGGGARSVVHFEGVPLPLVEVLWCVARSTYQVDASGEVWPCAAVRIGRLHANYAWLDKAVRNRLGPKPPSARDVIEAFAGRVLCNYMRRHNSPWWWPYSAAGASSAPCSFVGLPFAADPAVPGFRLSASEVEGQKKPRRAPLQPLAGNMPGRRQQQQQQPTAPLASGKSAAAIVVAAPPRRDKPARASLLAFDMGSTKCKMMLGDVFEPEPRPGMEEGECTDDAGARLDVVHYPNPSNSYRDGAHNSSVYYLDVPAMKKDRRAWELLARYR